MSRLAWALAFAAIDYIWRIRWAGCGDSVELRAAWLQRHSRLILKALAVRHSSLGEIPRSGVLVCNHLSYLDILVLGAQGPLVFISKAEVAHWPIFGFLTKAAGTLFIHRERRSDVVRLGREMPKIVEAGGLLAFFPEGTSSDGAAVLPFHSALLAPVVENGWSVTPATLSYRLPPGEGCAESEVAYWGDAVFGHHLLQLLGKSQIEAQVCYSHTERAGSDRRELAQRLYERVVALHHEQKNRACENTGAA